MLKISFLTKMHFHPGKSQNAQHEHTCIIQILIQEVKDI